MKVYYVLWLIAVMSFGFATSARSEFIQEWLEIGYATTYAGLLWLIFTDVLMMMSNAITSLTKYKEKNKK